MSKENPWCIQDIEGCGLMYTHTHNNSTRAPADPQTAEPRLSDMSGALKGTTVQTPWMSPREYYQQQQAAAAQANQGDGLHGDIAHRLAERDELKADNERLRKELEEARHERGRAQQLAFERGEEIMDHKCGSSDDVTFARLREFSEGQASTIERLEKGMAQMADEKRSDARIIAQLSRELEKLKRDRGRR